MKKQCTILIALLLMAISASGQTVRTRLMNFENSGNRRILKTEKVNHWYYRSLPEKALRLNVEGVERVQLRSFGIEALRKPQIIVIIDKQRTPYNLTLNSRLNGYFMYQDIEFDIPAGSKTIEVLCYQRSIYMRAFQMITVKAKVKKVVTPSLELKAHAGMIEMKHNSTTSEYYSFNATQPLKFQINKARNGIVYIRARLNDRSLPVFTLYKDGAKVESYEFSLARTSKFSATGVRYLTIGKKLNLPINDNSSEYELRADSDHMFMARPLLLKK